jgi:hypothetical protein
MRKRRKIEMKLGIAEKPSVAISIAKVIGDPVASG